MWPLSRFYRSTTFPGWAGLLNMMTSCPHNRKLSMTVPICWRKLPLKTLLVVCSYVFNVDVPRNMEEYVHRVGRTGRAGRLGCSITLVTRRDWAQASQLIDILAEANQVNKLLSLFRGRPQGVGDMHEDSSGKKWLWHSSVSSGPPTPEPSSGFGGSVKFLCSQ